MAQNWRRCEKCGYEALITNTAADVDGPHWPPSCPVLIYFGLGDADGMLCGGVMEIAPRPGDFAIDAKEPFQRFTVHRQVPTSGGLMQVEETIDSVHTLRRIEQDSEQRYRNGEGEPLRFRMWNQDRTNKDVGSFGTAGRIGDRAYDSGRTPQGSKKVGTKRHGPRKPKIAVAKGAGGSPLR
jgi:hypothetical protein